MNTGLKQHYLAYRLFQVLNSNCIQFVRQLEHSLCIFVLNDSHTERFMRKETLSRLALKFNKRKKKNQGAMVL